MSTHFQEDEILGKAYDARLMRRLLRYLRPYRRAVTASIVLLLLAAAADLAGPYFVKVAIDHYIQVRDIGGVAMVSALYLGTVVLGAAVPYWQRSLTQHLGPQ